MVSSIADLRANIRELFQSIVMDESELDTFLTQLENHHII